MKNIARRKNNVLKADDRKIEKAKQKFFRSLFILFLAIIYLILPDPVPGPLDDIPLLAASAVYTGLTYYKLKKQQEKLNS